MTAAKGMAASPWQHHQLVWETDKLHYDELAFCSHLKVVLHLSLITAAHKKKINKSTQKLAFILLKSYLTPPFCLPGFSSPR